MIALRMWLVALALVLTACPAAQQKKDSLGNPCGGGDEDQGDGGARGGEELGDGVAPPDEVERTEAEEDGDAEGDDDAAPAPEEAERARAEEAKKSERARKRKSKRSSGNVRAARAAREAKRRLDLAEAERSAAVDRSDSQRAALVRPRMARGLGALRGKDYDRAIVIARQVLALDGAHAGAIALLAESYYRKGWNIKAARVLRAATGGSGAKDARLWMLRGLVADARKEPIEHVKEAYLRATKLAPRYAKAWNNLGVVYLRLRMYTKATAAFETALANDKDSTSVLTNAGTAYRRYASEARLASQRDELLRKAERAYRTAIAIDEDYAPAYLNLGVLYLDAPSFPSMTTEQRLAKAASYLREFKKRGVPANAEDGSPIAVDAYLDAAKKQLEALELARRLEKKTRDRGNDKPRTKPGSGAGGSR